MPTLIQDWVTRHAAERPRATAVVLERDSLTYGELDTLSGRLANALRDAGVERGDRVCLLMPKTPLAVAAIVGIYKAGAVYVPLDTTSPTARLAAIVPAAAARGGGAPRGAPPPPGNCPQQASPS
jgi:acyl-CoA synthetase (AMP-forming)/AMP-acid ligase II